MSRSQQLESGVTWPVAARPAPGASGRQDLPVPRQSVALGLKILVDEAALAFTLARYHVPSRNDRRRIGAEVEAARQIFGERGWLCDPIRYHHVPPRLEKLELHRKEVAGIRFLHLRFDSGYEPHFGEPGRARWINYGRNETAHAWVLRHSGKPRPWLMCVHGYGMGSPGIDLAGFNATWLHRRLGLNLVFPVLPLHGPRRIGRQSGDGFLSGDILNAVHGEAHAMWDLRRILGWVREQGAPAVGVYGLSLGGYTTALLASLEADLACVIAGVPATDFARLASRHRPRLLLRYTKETGLSWNDAEPVLRVVSPLSLRPVVSRERRYLFGGLVDRLVPVDQVHDLWNHWERPRAVWYDGSHLSFPFERQVRELLREALSRLANHRGT